MEAEKNSTSNTIKKITKRLGIFIGSVLGIVIVSVVSIVIVLHYLNIELKDNKRVFVNGMQELQASIPWSDTRQKSILFMQEEILLVDSIRHLKEPKYRMKRILAYEISENNFKLCAEIYKTIDPLFLLAIQYTESKFQIKRKGVDSITESTAGAMNINQVMPSTAKFLVRGLNRQWSDAYLTDPIKNTELAVDFINSLYAEKYTHEQVLAAYNCCYNGPEKYLNDPTSLPPETRKYIPDVMKKYAEYKNRLSKYEVVSVAKFE